MNEAGRSMILLAVGMTIGRMTWNGTFGNFVQQNMRWPLAIAAVIITLLGLVDLLRWARRSSDDDPWVAPAVGLLLVAPLMVLIAVAPTSLGAAAADRVDAYEPPPPETDVWALPDDDPLEMRVVDFVNQAIYDEEANLEGRSIVMEGLVVNDPEVDDGFLLVRFLVSCCAADGIPVKIALLGATEEYENDTWIRATVVWRPPEVPYSDPDAPLYVEADIEDIEVVPDPPDSPYESPF